jgi:hypothetical protein
MVFITSALSDAGTLRRGKTAIINILMSLPARTVQDALTLTRWEGAKIVLDLVLQATRAIANSMTHRRCKFAHDFWFKLMLLSAGACNNIRALFGREFTVAHLSIFFMLPFAFALL